MMEPSDPNEVEPVDVSPKVRAYVESLGAPGHRWLAELPEAVQRQCEVWALKRGEALSGGTRSYVCRVITSDGQRAVLKLALPEPSLATQISTLVAAQGRGYVQVFAHDLDTGALLLESLGPSAEASLDSVPAVLALTAQALVQAWQVPLECCAPLRDESEHKAAGLFALVNELAADRDDPALQPVVDQALRYAQTRLMARYPEREVVVHGDPHAGNLLRVEQARAGAETGYVLVDPEGFVCEPEYDLGVALRDWNTQLLASSDPQAALRAWCEQLARATRTEAEAIWQWAYLERVSTALYVTHHGMPHVGRPFLAVAHRLLG